MHAKTLFAIAAVAALASAAARADDITIDNTPFQSTRSRAEVLAELGLFQQSGVNPWSNRYNPLARLQSVKSRAEVQAEYRADRSRVAAMTGEDSGSFYLSQAPLAHRGTTLAGTPVSGQ
jgi:hypothetical protein